jgi:hypothetical protein
MVHKLRIAAVLVILSALAAAGCGSQQANGHTQLVAQADPICKQVAAKRSAANSALPSSLVAPKQTLQVLARVAPGVAAYEHDAVRRLRALSPPASLAQDWQEMLAGMQRLANDTSTIGYDAKAKKFDKAHQVVVSGRKLQERLNVIATRDGFAYCGRAS